jgi:predicted aldo/keto reductase-like oxidoreductase
VLREYGREKVFIATKIPPYSRSFSSNKLNSAKAMEERLEVSLKRLRTDYVDVLFLHNIKDPVWPTNDEMLRFCERTKEKGAARFVGVSLHSEGRTYVDTVTESVDCGAYDVILAALNFKSHQQELDVLRYAHSKNVGVIAMKTQAGGYNGDNRQLNQHQAALRWVLDLDFVDCAIPGMVNRRQLAENVGVMGMQMGWRHRKELATYYDAIKDRYCLRCGSCQSLCKQTVNIPSIHRCLMYWEGYEDYTLGRTRYRRLSAEENASACLNCTEPTCNCKYGINIKKRMRYAHTSFTQV